MVTTCFWLSDIRCFLYAKVGMLLLQKGHNFGLKGFWRRGGKLDKCNILTWHNLLEFEDIKRSIDFPCFRMKEISCVVWKGRRIFLREKNVIIKSGNSLTNAPRSEDNHEWFQFQKADDQKSKAKCVKSNCQNVAKKAQILQKPRFAKPQNTHILVIASSVPILKSASNAFSNNHAHRVRQFLCFSFSEKHEACRGIWETESCWIHPWEFRW